MPLDLQSLSTDTLLYMLMHSGVFVAVMGAAFFLIGLIFGYATWGRYKVHSRRLAGEIDQQRQEIATLKRKLGDQAVKPGTVSIATETISMAPEAEPPPVSEAPHSLPPPSPSLPAEVITDTITTSEGPTAATSGKAKPQRTKTTLKPKPVIAPIPVPETSASTSALASIIASHPANTESKMEGTSALSLAAAVETLDVIPAFPELPAAAVEIKPELDAKLGLVYKAPPSKPDDLTKLKGIARVLEQRLHEFGIYTYEQIASWTEDHIKELSSRLAFKDRIHREKWVEQAKRLKEDRQKAA